MTDRTCAVDGCLNPPRSGKADWCKKHYHRWYRHGDVNLCAIRSGITASQGRRYRSTHQPSHPLAKPSGRVYVHQVVLYAAIGADQHPCHWCGMGLRWDAEKGAPNRLTVDHLNGKGDDNERTNLVPSCPRCNSMRGGQARSDALRQAGWWAAHDTVAKLGREAPVAPHPA